jgi:hypothetical protein
MANRFHGGHFLFFLLGIAFQTNAGWREHKIVLYISSLIYCLLAPLWSRLDAFNLISSAPFFLKNYFLGAAFTVIVALSGSIATYISLNLIMNKIPKKAPQVFILIGSNTLGIYALQGYFISIKPIVGMSITLSLGVTLILSRIPILRIVFIGKRVSRSSLAQERS